MKPKALGVLVLIALFAESSATAMVAEKIPVWPLFYYQAADGRKDLEILWPVFDLKQRGAVKQVRFLAVSGYKYDGGKKETLWELLWPVWRIAYSESGEKLDARFFPLFYGKEGKRKYLVVFPEIWFKDYGKGAYTFVLLPFFRDRDEKGDSLTGFFPWWVKRGEKRLFANLFPLIVKKTADQYDAIVLFPLFYRLSGDTYIFPFYADFGDTLIVFPFYGKGKFKKWFWEAILPPLYFAWGDGEYIEHDFLWPVGAWGKGGGRERLALRPLYEYTRRGDYRRHDFLAYLGAWGRGPGHKLDRLFPLFNYDRTPTTHSLAVLWPLWSERKGDSTYDRRALTILPVGLFRFEEPRRSWHVFNLAWWAKRADAGEEGFRAAHGFYPLYSYAESARKEGPRREGTGEFTIHRKDFNLLDPLTPLDLRHFRFSQTPLALAFPLFRSSDEEWEGGSDKRCGLPLGLFDYSRRFDGAERDSWSLEIEAPFVLGYWSWGHGKRRELRLLTFFWDIHRPEGRSQGLWPLYTYKATRKGGLNASFLDPLWFWGEATGEEEHVSALLKIFDFRRKPNGDSRFSFIWRVFRREVRGENVSVESFPFLDWEKTPETFRFGFLWRVFAYEKKRDGARSFRLFFSPPIRLGGGK